MANQGRLEYILGLDIGANSVGWAVLASEGEGNKREPVKIINAGVRVFEEGVDVSKGSLQRGTDVSRNVARRDNRSQRRQHDRRARRRKKIFDTLQRNGLLPFGDVTESEDRHQYLLDFDKSIFAKYCGEDKVNEPDSPDNPHVIPYWLRARALDNKMELHELGRAIYHLAQRRGFKSNRLAPEKDDDRGVVKPKIEELNTQMADAGARTMGEFFSKLDPEEKRIRTRYTARKMYEDEFNKMWDAQTEYHPDVLTDDFRQKLHRALFFQRPLKSQKHLIGNCEHEPTCRRSPIAMLDAQRFRLLQQVNNTRIFDPDGKERELTEDEVKILIEALDTRGDITFARAKNKKVLGLPKGSKFNWESGEEKRFVGNRTAAKMVGVFGDRWQEFNDAEKEQLVEDVRSFQDSDALIRRAMRVWGLNDEKAKEFAAIQLEDGYLHVSRRAIGKLLPRMEEGEHYMTAVKEVYGVNPPTKAKDNLLPAEDVLGELRNPAVTRALSELRKVVNSIIREYGKPAIVRVEMARDLKRSRKEKVRITRNMRNREKEREKAKERIKDELGIENPSRATVEKVLLADECGWQCPYTGKHISMQSLIGENPQFDVEHIIPFSRCLDNSFLNKTLCDTEENRNIKRNKTPHEAYAGNDEKWGQILSRVAGFAGEMRQVRAKIERFQMEEKGVGEMLDDFSNRQLTDTRYASKVAAKYLGELYGGRDDETRTRCIQVGVGQITEHIRDELGLNAILGDGRGKSRDDHRHHAVDAIAIALTDAKTVKRLSDAATRAQSVGRKRFGPFDQPWDGFLDDARQAVEKINVSHRIDRKVSGQLHEETLYGLSPEMDKKGKPKYVHVRKRLEELTVPMLKNIVDPVVRERVKSKLVEMDMKEPKKAFKLAENHPYIVRNGKKIFIHKVRIRRKEKVITIGAGPRVRNVKTGSNHHLEVFEVKDKKGGVKWDGRMVSMMDAVRRRNAGEPIVNRAHEEGSFVFTLGGGEILMLNDGFGNRRLFRIRTISENKQGNIYVAFVLINDARKKKDIIEAGGWNQMGLEALRKANCRKVIVTPLGEERQAND